MKRAISIFFVLLVFLSFTSGCSSSESEDTEATATSEASDSQESSHSGEDSDSFSGESEGSEKEGEKSGVITVGGSTALQPLITMAVGKFMESGEFKGAITINGSNSLAGLSEVGEGSVNVGMSDISPEQAGIDGTGLTDNQVAIVAIGVVVSKDVAANPDGYIRIRLKKYLFRYHNGLETGQGVEGWKRSHIRNLPQSRFGFPLFI